MSEPENENTPRPKRRFRPFATSIAAITAYVLSGQQERNAERAWSKKWRRREVWGIWAAAFVGAVAIAWSVLSTSKQLSEMRAEQRPWVSAQKIMGNGPISSDTGGITIPLTLEILNSGHGPAFYVEVSLLPRLLSSHMFDPVAQQKNCERKTRFFGVSLFPNQVTSLSYSATVTPKDIETENAQWPPNAKPPLTIFMLACVLYTDAISGTEHYTPYILKVGPMANGRPGNIKFPIDAQALAKLPTAVTDFQINVIPPT
jgi:hypothetical protein